MDTFSVLKDGVSFDRKRFAADISLFAESRPMKHSKISAPMTTNLRKEFQIHTSGSDVPLPLANWDSVFNSHTFPESTQTLVRSLYPTLTPIQMQAIPTTLLRRDLIAISPTGSGKTLSYLLPLISLLGSHSHLRSLIISPTKELARQIFKEFLYLSEGSELKADLLRKNGKTLAQLQQEIDILICTPLTMVHCLEEILTGLEFIVMDEADQLFDLGYLEQLDEILKKCPGDAVKSMFSATMLQNIEVLAYSMLINPIKISIGMQNSTVASVSQELKFCTNEVGKLVALKQMAQEGEILPPVLVFVQSKDRAMQLSNELKAIIPHVGAIHSGLDDKHRDIVVKSFRTGQLWVLICTDLMSRGIDFHGVKLVINYDFPQTIISYIHRIGRAGRAGEEAKAVTLYTIEDAPYLKMIANVMNKSGVNVPQWMMEMKAPNKSQKKKIEKRPIRRENISSKLRICRTLRKFMQKKRGREVTQE